MNIRENFCNLSAIFDDRNILCSFCDLHKMGFVDLVIEDKITAIDYNDIFYNMLNVTPNEFINTYHSNFDRFLNIENKNKLKRAVLNQNDNNIEQVTIEICSKGGKFLHLDIIGKTITVNSQQVFRATITDVTNDVKINLVKSKNDNLKTILSLLNITMIEYDIKKDELIHEETTARKFGLPLILKNPLQELPRRGLVPPESANAVTRWFKRVHAGESIVEERISTVSKDGNKVHLRILGQTFSDENGVPFKVIGINQDITNEVYLEKEKEYSISMTSDKFLIYEANLTTDTTINVSETWLKANKFTTIKSFTKMMYHAAHAVVDPDYLQGFLDNFSSNALIEKYNAGERTLTYDYRRIMPDGSKLWYEITATMIYSKSSASILARVYINDVNEDKVKMLKLNEEKAFYDKMSPKSFGIYEINFTAKEFLGDEDKHLRSLKRCGRFDDIFSIIPASNISSDDLDKVKSLSDNYFMSQFSKTNHEIVFEFKILLDGDYQWVRATFRLFDNPEKDSFMGYMFIEDINIEKTSEIDLIYKAQHDMLTGLYNKVTTKEKISEILFDASLRGSSHAFFMIDLDNFKQINDSFGHAYGDYVLKDVSSHICALFRDCDIVGRVGGDEFVVLLKNIPDNDIVITKAQGLCDVLNLTYEEHGTAISISASVGVEICHAINLTFDEVFEKADKALYVSKKSGKSRFTINNSAMQDTLKNLPFSETERGTTFLDNYADSIFELVFEAMYSAANKEQAVNAALAIIGSHYCLDRIIIRKFIENTFFMTSTFEWTKKAEYRLGNANLTFTKNNTEEQVSLFDTDGVALFLANDKPNEFIGEILTKHGVYASIAIIPRTLFGSIKPENGFISYEYLSPSNKDLSEVKFQLKKLTDLLSLFF